MRWVSLWALLLGAIFPVETSGSPAGADLDRARSLYEKSDYNAALNLLANISPKDGAVLLMMGQCYYLSGDAKAASTYFENATAADPHDPRALNWLGRAYGRRAETASFLSAPGLALKARRSFEAALKMAPDDLELIGDLFEYYLDAPGILGGGMDRAEALATRVQQLDLAEFHYEQARLAERREQAPVAERHLRQAAELAPNEPGRLVDLAEFLDRQGRQRESDEVFARAGRMAPEAPLVWFEQAKTYIQSNREISAAKSLLQRYFASRITPRDPQLYEARRLWKRLPGVN